jgi:DNA-binding Lrp family transcriptional regulator
MPSLSAERTPERPVPSQDVRPLDDTDLAILRVLGSDARVSNKELAERVGVAQSTCLARVRALRESGVIRGYYADIDPRALGHDVQAMIAIRLQPHARGAMREVVTGLSRRPEVLDVYFVAGATDFLVHVATADTDGLRRFVADHLNRNRAIAGTETNLIFEHVRAAGRGA